MTVVEDITNGAAGRASRIVSAASRPWLFTMAWLSLVALFIGAGLGLAMSTALKRDMDAPAAHKQSDGGTQLIEVPPIITNLADPSNVWVRLQIALVIDNKTKKMPEILAAEIGDDILGFMKTVSLAQIGGASGLQHLREDLTERAVIRSQGHVHELILQTMVVQ